MNKKMLPLLITVPFILTGCGNGDGDDDMIWDFNPAGIEIMIVDEQGNNLLNPETEGNWMGSEFQVECDDELYTANWTAQDNEPGSRFYMPTFMGLKAERVFITSPEKSNDYYLYFGEFDGSCDQDIEMKFAVPGRNGLDNISLSHRVTWKKKNPEVTNTITLNGQQYDGSCVRIVLPRRR